jgi:hypothetical protein
MAMHYGPVRHTMTVPAEAAIHTLDLIVHETDHQTAEEDQHIQTTYRGSGGGGRANGGHLRGHWRCLKDR